VRPLQRDRSSVFKAGCAIIFALFWTAFSLIWLAFGWFMGASLPMQVFGLIFVAMGFSMLGRALWTGLIRPIMVGRMFGEPNIRISDDPLRVGQAFMVRYRQQVRRGVEIRRTVLQVILRESATSGSGTDRSTVTYDHVIQEYASEGRRLYANDEILEEWRTQIPSDAMHTFDGGNNQLLWLVRVNVEVERFPDVWEEMPFTVNGRLPPVMEPRAR
jgi:hypothetical protein